VPGGGDGECLEQSEHSLGSHQKSSEVIRGHQRSSEVVRGLQRSSEVIRGPHVGLAFIKGLEDHRVLVLLATGVAALVPHPGIPEGAQLEPIWEAIRRHQRPSEVIKGHQRPSEAISVRGLVLELLHEDRDGFLGRSRTCECEHHQR